MLLAAAGVAGNVSFAGAPNVSVYPVRITLSGKAAAGQLELGNSGDAPDRLQSQVFGWTRQHCVDSTEPADTLVVSPPIFQLEPNSKQVVRVLLIGAASEQTERAMRLVLTEIGTVTPQFGSVSARLAISLPVFVLPSVPAAPRVEWSVVRDGARLHVTAHNVGNAHTRLHALTLVGADGAILSDEPHTDYLLAGDACEWTLAAQNAVVGIRVIAVTEERETTLDVSAP